MIKKFFYRIKGLLFSLRVGFIVVFLASVALGVGVFFAGTFGVSQYIENVYVAEENKKEREDGYLRDLQKFIDDNNISSAETGKISQWARENQYVYLLIYKDDKIFFTSDDVTEDEKTDDEIPEDEKGDTPPADNVGDEPSDEENIPGGDSTDEGEEEIRDNENEDKKDEEPTNPGVTVQYPTREELLAYAQKNDMHMIELSDGPLFASFAEFTEYLYYDIANIVSLIVAALLIVIIMLVYIQRVTVRIIRLGNDVNKVAAGDTEHNIRAKGSDEISDLAANVDGMRSSLVETLKKERQALDSNTELITSMSHDLRTPLTVLLGYIDVMRSHAKDDEEMQGYIRAAESTALRLKKLSDDMFGYFLVFGGKEIEPELDRYDADMLLGQMLSEHVLLMKESGYSVESDDSSECDLSGKTVVTNAQMLVRIFDNAFSNLYKYADKKKPVIISITHRACEVNVRIENFVRTDGEKVESNGIGLKTCGKLAELIRVNFSHGAEDNKYFVNLTLPIEDK